MKNSTSTLFVGIDVSLKTNVVCAILDCKDGHSFSNTFGASSKAILTEFFRGHFKYIS